MKPQIKPTAMPCTEEQWLNEMKPLCDKHGLKSKAINNFSFNTLLTNYFQGEEMITNLSSSCSPTIPYHPELFLYNSGIFPEKWAVRGSKELRMFAEKMGWDLSAVDGKYKHHFYYLDSENEIHTDYNQETMPSADHVEVTLEELMFHYEQKADMKTEQPKWEDRTRGGYEYKIYEEFDGKIWGRFKDKTNRWFCASWELNGDYLDNEDNVWDLIPYNPLKAQLLAEKEELKKRIEEIDRELKK